MPATADLPRGTRVLESLADAIRKLLSEQLVDQGRVDTDVILTTVTSVIARNVPVTCIAILMKSDPDMSRIVTADAANQVYAQYIDDFVATMTRPRDAPTSGLSQRVIQAGAPLFIPRMSLDQYLPIMSQAGRDYVQAHPRPSASNFNSVLMVPMHAGPATVGTLGLVDWNATGTLTEEDIGWMQNAADRIGLTVDYAQTRNRATDRLTRLTALSEIALAVASSQDARLTLKLIIDRVAVAFRVDAVDILLLDDGDNVMSVAAGTGFKSRTLTEARLPISAEAGAQLRLGRTMTLDWMGHARRSAITLEGHKDYIATPLKLGERWIGLLEVFSRSVIAPDAESLSFLETMASHAAVAMDRAAAATTNRSAEPATRTARLPRPLLTDREHEILKLLVEGDTNREVGDRLHLSANTIKFHVRQLLEKTGVANRTELATRAIQQGWV